MGTRDLDLWHLRMFVNLVEHKTLKDVAKIMGVTPSAVSQGVRALEESLGENVELFSRETRPMTLTLAGRRLIEEGKALLLASESLASRIASIDLKKQSLRLGLGETPSSTFSPWLIRELQPQVKELIFTSGLSLPLIEKLSKEQLDVLVCADASWAADQFSRTPVYKEEYLVISGKRGAELKTMEDLRAMAQTHPFVWYNNRSSDAIEISRIIRSLAIEPIQKISVDSSYTLVGVVSLLDGWSILPATNILSGQAFASELKFQPIPAGKKISRTTWCIGDSHTQTAKIELVTSAVIKVMTNHVMGLLEKSFPGSGKYISIYKPEKEA